MVVMQELIDERAEAIDEVYKSLVEVNEMFSDLSRIVKEQQVGGWRCCDLVCVCGYLLCLFCFALLILRDVVWFDMLP